MSTLLPLSSKPGNKRLLFLICIALFILVGLILTSCFTEKQRAKICATCPHEDSVRIVKKDTIIYRDSVRLIELAGDTVKIQLPCPLPSFDIVKKKNGIKTEIKSDGKAVTCDCSAAISDTVKKIRADHYAEIDSTKNETHLIQCDKPHLKWYDPICRVVTLIVLIGIIILILIGAYKIIRAFKASW